MNILGKARPETNRLNRLSQEGFDAVELYLNTDILDSYSISELVSTCQKAEPLVKTVHTPHIDITEPQSYENNPLTYFHLTEQLALELGAIMVIDSNPTSIRYTPNIFPHTESQVQVGYENDPSISKYYLQNYHLPQYPLVLDTAHLHMSEKRYSQFLVDVLQQYSVSKIPVIHLADGTRYNDGLPFTEGTVDLTQILTVLDEYCYQGCVVLEAPSEDQPEALQFVESVLRN